MEIEKILLAPDSFKESMTAKEACIAMEKGIKKVNRDIECIHVPMADGGEGTARSLVDVTEGIMYKREVCGPLGEKVIAEFGILGDKKTAIIEMAEASGLALVPLEKRNPMKTTTYGVGELIKEVLDKKVKKIIIGLGGSATNDGGAGMLQALGVKLLDREDKEISFGGEGLSQLDKIDISGLDRRLEEIKIEVACDVKNYLTGENGASYVFGPQKGAIPEIVEVLDRNLKRFAEIVRRDLNKEIDKIEGAGAAGGLGAAIVGFLNGKTEKGIDLVIKYSKLEEKIKDVDLVFTGEGSVDFQTKFGKTPVGVSSLAKKYNKPTIAFGGRVGENIDDLYSLGINSVVGIMPGVMSLEEALEKGSENLTKTVESIVRILQI